MRKLSLLSIIFVTVALGALLDACTDDVDKSDMYTFRGQTVLDILSTDPDYSNYKALLERVKFSSNVIAADNEKVGSSTAAQLLATRGNYTRHVELKMDERQIAARRYQQTMKEIRRIEGIIAQQRRWNQERIRSY